MTRFRKLAKVAFFAFAIAPGLFTTAGGAGSEPMTDEAKSMEHNGEPDETMEMAPEIVLTVPEPLPEGKMQPWRLVRSLQKVQDEIANGTPNSLGIYRKLLVETSRWLQDLDEHVWAHERNVLALAVYVLAGGNPSVGRQVQKVAGLNPSRKRSLEAALAYVDRDYYRARNLLLEIDHTILPHSAAGQFALAKAMVTSSRDIDVAMEYLDEVRRLSPGTLLEEAALRRSIRISGEKRDIQKLSNYSNLYLRRFDKSAYFGDFLRNYAVGVVKVPKSQGAEVLKHLKSVLPQLSDNQKVFLVISVLRGSVISGRLVTGRWASNWLLNNTQNNDKFRARIKLYSIAMGILDPDDFDEAFRNLKQLPREQFQEQDQKLHDALMKMGRRIGSAPIDIEKLKNIIQIERQNYPGDEVELPFDVEAETEKAINSELVVESGKLLKNADTIMKKL